MDNTIFSGIIKSTGPNKLWCEDAILTNIKFIKGSITDFITNLVMLKIFPTSIYNDYIGMYYINSNYIAIYINGKPITSDFFNTELIFYMASPNFDENLETDKEIHEILSNNG